jgi:hypothetical protein
MPPMPMTCGEHLLRKGAEKTGRRAISMRVAMLTAKPKTFMKGRQSVTTADTAAMDVMSTRCSTPSRRLCLLRPQQDA